MVSVTVRVASFLACVGHVFQETLVYREITIISIIVL